MRVEDIGEIEGVPTMRFDAEAGSLKTVGSERTASLHSALIVAGFLDFVRAQDFARKTRARFSQIPTGQVWQVRW
ncbi:hypothetical protein ASG59_16315 [Methylobacterium sp. Leaf466]|nr:hypothetical protein ASG59_16315 [Methylobacterium sp. Leaf466]